jgi:hypothetical protein
MEYVPILIVPSIALRIFQLNYLQNFVHMSGFVRRGESFDKCAIYVGQTRVLH